MMFVDTSMLVRRCLAKMDFLKNSSGTPTGMEFGTLRTLEMLEKKYPEHQIVLCLDSKKSWRKTISTEYKANRTSLDKSTYSRMDYFVDFLKCLYPTSIYLDHEADDVMYALSRSKPGPHFIYTNDNDLLQAVSISRQVKVLKSWNSKLFTWDTAKVILEYGVMPSRLPLYRAFIGDSSDNLKGVERIDRKLLADLITWCCNKGMNNDEMLQEIKTANWGSDKKSVRINGFIDSGKWFDNYNLMRLVESPNIKIDLPVENTDLVVKCLKKWEIASLNLCKEYKDELTESLSDEF